MRNKFLCMLFVSLFAACLACCFVWAQQGPDEGWAKISKLRREIKQVKYDYEQDLRGVNKECDDKVSAARGEFHKAREKYLKEKKEKLSRLEAAHKKKIQPMETEEKDLLQSLSPAQGDFAKRRK